MKQYVPVRINTIPAEIPVSFDIYIKLPSKYLLYIHKGDSIANDRVKQLKSKKVRQLFIASEDEQNYQKFLDQGLEDALSSDTLKSDTRAQIVTNYASGAVGDMQKDPGNKKSYTNTQKSAQSIAGALRKDPEILKKIFSAPGGEVDEDSAVESAVKCSTLAIKFSQALGFKSEVIEDIGTAALVRDIGIYQDTNMQKLFYRPYDKFTKEDWKIYKQHPTKAVELLQEKDYVSKRVIDLVLTHEERKSGDGFPNGLTKLTHEQEVLGLVSAYDRLVTVNKMTPSAAMEAIRVEEVGNFDLKLIKKFVTLLKKEGLVTQDAA